MAYSVASNLVLHCLPMSHKMDAGLLCADVGWSAPFLFACNKIRIFLDKAQVKVLHNIDTIAAR